MNIAFIIDESPSMSQRTSTGPSFLDCAKSGISYIIKSRSRSSYDLSKDTYHLITTDSEFPIKSSYEHDFAHLSTQLSQISKKPKTLGINEAISVAFDQLNAFRHLNSTDTYGFGRNPSRVEPGAILVVSDNSLANVDPESWKTPKSSEFTANAWRYDQRVYLIMLQSCSYFAKESQEALTEIAERTGGAFFYCFSFQNMIGVCEKVCSYLNDTVFTINVENDEKTVFPLICKLDRKTKNNSWPVPEEFTHFAHGLPARPSNPKCYIKQIQMFSNLKIPAEFPFDCYEVAKTKKSQELLGSGYSAEAGYLPVYMRGHMSPFGVLAIEENSVKLLLFIYNFTEFWECKEYFRTTTGTNQERAKHYEERMNIYLKELPVYYRYALNNYLKKQNIVLPSFIKIPNSISLSTEVTLQLKQLKERETSLKSEIELIASQLALQHLANAAQCCEGARYSFATDIFSITKESLGYAVSSLKAQFFSRLKHEVSTAEMGNYLDASANSSSLRNAYLESGAEKLTPINFGNPFRASAAAAESNLLFDDPNISIPTQRLEKVVAAKPQTVTLPVKRPRGYKLQLEEYKFLKRTSKSDSYLVVLEAIALLRERNEQADSSFLKLIKSNTSRVYKNKGSNTIKTYQNSKMKLLDAMVEYATLYNKLHLIPHLEQLKLSL